MRKRRRQRGIRLISNLLMTIAILGLGAVGYGMHISNKAKQENAVIYSDHAPTPQE